MSPIRVTRALISVADKTGLIDLAHGLARHNVKLLSTGGTAVALRESGFTVRDVAEVTGYPELFGGRVKTLHPAVHGGILYRRGHARDEEERHRHGVVSIELVVVNLYPFEQTIARPGVADEEAVEQIDVGGPAMIRAAAKNHRSVVVVVEPGQYAELLAAMDRGGGSVPAAMARAFARVAFERTSSYDAAIARYLEQHEGGAGPADGAESSEEVPAGVPRAVHARTARGGSEAGNAGGATLPERWAPSYRRKQILRYGENPGQEGALYAAESEAAAGRGGAGGAGSATAVEALTQLRGKTLSYNNLLDVDAALALLREFEPTAAVVIKHRNPSGAALAARAADAVIAARDADSLSAFGGILAINRPLDAAVAEAIGAFFFEVVAAPAITAPEERLAALRKNLVLLETGELAGAGEPLAARSFLGGLLLETPLPPPRFDAWTTVTKKAPTKDQLRDLHFGWRVARHVVSNAIVIARGERTLGVGAGQSSRVDAVRLALWKAERSGHDVRGAVLCSDAFFPFPDSVEIAARAGIAAIAHPGGSVRDAESTAAADDAGIAMAHTGERCFLH